MPQRSKWPLPDVTNPPNTRCFKVIIPDEHHYIAAFKGAMYDLAKAYAWGDDSEHTALIVAAKMLETYENLIEIDCEGGETLQTLIEYDDLCGLKWSYDGGLSWTNIDLSICADTEIINQIMFQVENGKLKVSLDGGLEYGEIYDAPAIADTEIINQIMFQVENGKLKVSLDGGLEYGEIYDAPDLADTEILNKILFGLNGTKLTVSLDGGLEYGDIYDAASIADTEILNKIEFQQDDIKLNVSLDGGLEYANIYDPTDELGPIIEDYINSPAQIQPVETPPVGQCTTVDFAFTASDIAYAPFLVNTGDELSFASIQGAWWSTADQFHWYCANQGFIYAAGACGVLKLGPKTGDLAPLLDHGSLIVKIGSTYYEASETTPIYVPAGIVNQPVRFEMNSTSADYAQRLGNCSFQLTFCPAVGTWEREFDFSTGQLGWTPVNYYQSTTVYVADIGFNGSGQPNIGVNQFCIIKWAFGVQKTGFIDVSAIVQKVGSTNAPNNRIVLAAVYNDAAGSQGVKQTSIYGVNDNQEHGGTLDLTGTFNPTTLHIRAQIEYVASEPAAEIHKLVFRGYATDPWE